MRSTLLALGAVATLASASAAQAATELYSASMEAAAETPPNKSLGWGQASANLDTDTKVLSYNIAYADLTGPASAAHFHLGAPGAAGPPTLPITGDLASPIIGKATLTDAQIADLRAGKWYVNIHTNANKGGEIRGQVKLLDLSTVYPKGFGPSSLGFAPGHEGGKTK